MDELNTVYISNFKPDITDREIGRFLLFMGYDNFVVQLGIRTGSLSTKRWAFCFVEFENLIDANNLRNELLEVSAQIGKCMPHRYSQCENQWTSLKINSRQPNQYYMSWNTTPRLQTRFAESRSYNVNNGHLCTSACTIMQIRDGHGTTHQVYSVWKPMIINEHLN